METNVVNMRCHLCQERPFSNSCYVRRDGRESATCRRCWEQVFLDPRRVLETLRGREGRGAMDGGAPRP